MARVAYNACFGGFSLSKKALLWMAERGHTLAVAEVASQEDHVKVPPKDALDQWAHERWANGDESDSRLRQYSWHCHDMDRADPLLVACIEALGADASGPCAELMLAEIPSGGRYRIDEYDGNETVMTPEDYEWSIAP